MATLLQEIGYTTAAIGKWIDGSKWSERMAIVARAIP